jgi:DNA polymerase III alpha subunit
MKESSVDFVHLHVHSAYDLQDGAKDNVIDTQSAENIFEMEENAGGYVALKAHCVAYAMISYQMAYLKAHFSTEFNKVVNRNRQTGS